MDNFGFDLSDLGNFSDTVSFPSLNADAPEIEIVEGGGGIISDVFGGVGDIFSSTIGGVAGLLNPLSAVAAPISAYFTMKSQEKIAKEQTKQAQLKEKLVILALATSVLVAIILRR